MYFRVAALSGILFLASCDLSPDSPHGFRLPDGDAEAGRIVFEEKQCSSCHIIEALPELREGVEPEMDVRIGGMQTRIATQGELVSAVINPSHRIARGYRREPYVSAGETSMRTVNENLTVAELIDLVTFLQGEYEEFPDY